MSITTVPFGGPESGSGARDHTGARRSGRPWPLAGLIAALALALLTAAAVAVTPGPAAAAAVTGHAAASTAAAPAWSLVHSPNPVFPQGQMLGVSCPSGNACAVAGGDVIQRWNGTRWVIHHLPAGSWVAGVSCTSPTACTAVGDGGPGTLAERYS